MRLLEILLLVALTILSSPSVYPASRDNAFTPIKIPDNFPLGIVSTLRFDDFALLNFVSVEIHIAHPQIGDLLVQLECPNGRLVTLHNRTGGHQNNINATYPVKECENSNILGNWKLRINDNNPYGTGSLLSWKLHAKLNKSDSPLFRIEGLKDWYLIGNSMTSGNENLKLNIETTGKISFMGVSIDGGSYQRLTQKVKGFDGTINISQLPPGLHYLSLFTDGNPISLARLPFRRSHPLYVLMTTDWDSSDSRDSILQLHETLHTEHPGLKFTHFLGPYTFTDPSVSKARQTYLADWMKRLQASYQDEIGLHIHPFCNFVNTVPGVPCRIKPSDSYNQGDSTGYTVLSSAYSESEFLKLLRAADHLFMTHGLGKPTAFRTGSWAANAGTLMALAEDGFVADSSANNWARIEESQHDGNGMLFTWNKEHWRYINDISQPYFPNRLNPAISGNPSIPILEIPDNGSLVDYVTGDEMIEMFNVNWFGTSLPRPATFVMGFHPVSYSQGFHRRIEKALAHIDHFLASNDEGPVVYETISHVSRVFEDLSK